MTERVPPRKMAASTSMEICRGKWGAWRACTASGRLKLGITPWMLACMSVIAPLASRNASSVVPAGP